ncbi:MAG: hypothetical protein ACYDEO_29070, partial [Aggregatilineales bacterium]
TASFTFVLFDQTTFGSGTVQIPLTSQLEVSSFIQINPPSSLTLLYNYNYIPVNVTLKMASGVHTRAFLIDCSDTHLCRPQ